MRLTSFPRPCAPFCRPAPSRLPLRASQALPKPFETQQARKPSEARTGAGWRPPPRRLLGDPASARIRANPEMSANGSLAVRPPPCAGTSTEPREHERGRYGGGEGTAFSHAAAEAPSGEQRRELGRPFPSHTSRRQPGTPSREHRKNPFFFPPLSQRKDAFRKRSVNPLSPNELSEAEFSHGVPKKGVGEAAPA